MVTGAYASSVSPWSAIGSDRSFHVVDRTRKAAKCTKMTNVRVTRAKLYGFSLLSIFDIAVAVVAVYA